MAHVDLDRDWGAFKLQGALNAHLTLAQEAVAITLVTAVGDDFDARFSATARHYIYRILNRRAPPTFTRNAVWHVQRPLDVAAMHEAAQVMIGKHDFTTFRSVQCQSASPVKTLDRLDVVANGEMVEVYASARSFLHNQVRSMVGTIKRAGEGAWTTEKVRAALEAADRSKCGPVAPPQGLYLVKVDYPG